MATIDSPIVCQPILKPRVWGGRTLERLGKALPPNVAIGESWEIADLPLAIPEARTPIVLPDRLRGRTLGEVLADATLRREVMGDAPLTSEGGFPLLIKYLDARTNLSVQVHPSAEYASTHPEAHLKSEAWVIIDADPGAVIYKGLRPGLTRREIERDLASGRIVDDLVTIPVRPGDCHYLPSGECHALGAGILVAEVQTPSDTTFRLFDWGRPSGTGRELHVEQALECVNVDGSRETHKPHTPYRVSTADGISTTLLAATEYFEIERVDAEEGSGFSLVTNGLPLIIMAISGHGRIDVAGRGSTEVLKGMTMLVPASARDWKLTFVTPTWLLLVRVPSPLKNVLAG